jgi:hypothetical protein
VGDGEKRGKVERSEIPMYRERLGEVVNSGANSIFCIENPDPGGIKLD